MLKDKKLFGINKAHRPHTHKVDGKWCIDSVPINTQRVLIESEYLGIGCAYEHKFKSGKRIHKLKLVEALGPDAEVWFIILIKLFDMSTQKMAVKIEDDSIYYQWLSHTLRISRNKHSRKPLCKLDLAMIDISIQKALCES